MVWWLDFKLETIFATAPAASKNGDCFRSGQNQQKNDHLPTLILIRETHYKKAELILEQKSEEEMSKTKARY